MKKRTVSKLISLLVAMLFAVSIFTGCFGGNEVVEDEPTQDEIVPEGVPVIGGMTARADDKFTLRYTSDEPINPFRCENVYNDAVASLIYEGLFKVDQQFKPVPVLCSEYSTDDGISFYFDIIETEMHDGSMLTAADVIYSINQARMSSRYMMRLSNIAYCVTDGADGIYIELWEADRSLPALLDIPVIKEGSVDSDTPAGTGPYYYNSVGGNPGLSPFKGYRDPVAKLMDRIYLDNLDDGLLEERFANYTIDCIWEDTAGERPANLYSDHEARYYDTTILQYIGFNSSTPVFNDPNMRRAVYYAVNREQILNDVYDGYGQVANLVLNPSYYLYSEEWEEGYGYSVANISASLAASGLDDRNSDGYLEYPVSGEYQYFELKFLVCDSNQKKVEAAESIATNLRSVGLKIILVKLPWAEYKEALSEGEFDFYYAEVALNRDFDFRRILGDEGGLDYGEMGSEMGGEKCGAFLNAVTDVEKTAAAKELCDYVAENAFIVPIMYRQYVVYTHRGVISNFTPSVSGVFSDAAGWTVDLKYEE